MKNLTTLFALIVSCSVLGQSNPEFNPDYDGNGFIGVDDILGVLGYFDTTWEDPQFSCGDVMSYQGYDYTTVLIGDQCWMAENLRNENYQNGDSILSNLSDFEWSTATTGASAVYGEGNSSCLDYSPDGDACDETFALSEYGRSYNWFAVNDDRGLCPCGWHVPTQDEWTDLANAVGGLSVAADALKSDFGWWNEGNATNPSGFSALPGGNRATTGYFSGGSEAYFWSSTPVGDAADIAYMYWNSSHFWQYDIDLKNGCSVRCIQDSE